MLKISASITSASTTGLVNCAVQERSGFWHDGRSAIGCARVNPNAQPPIVEVKVEFVAMKIRQLNCNI